MGPGVWGCIGHALWPSRFLCLGPQERGPLPLCSLTTKVAPTSPCSPEPGDLRPRPLHPPAQPHSLLRCGSINVFDFFTGEFPVSTGSVSLAFS